ncbi:hypothetical protein TNCV_2434791 [Trichonephila clavipes]|nr:hypothetical protein TNCV_2434791 [Trichonephila clavipes]
MPEGYIFRQEGAPCQYHNDIRTFRNADVPVTIGRGGVLQCSQRRYLRPFTPSRFRVVCVQDTPCKFAGSRKSPMEKMDPESIA